MRTFIFAGQIVFEAEDIDDALQRLAAEFVRDFEAESIALPGTNYEIKPQDETEEQS